MYQARFRVDNELAVVTGGGRGIGLACADALGEAGARLVIIEPDEQIGSAGKDALTAKGYSVELMLGDVTSSARMTEIADTLAARGTPASILINNAGVGKSGISSEDVDDELLAVDDERQRQRRLLVLARFRPAHDCRPPRLDRQSWFDVGHDLQPPAAANALQCLQGGRASYDPVDRRRMGAAWRAGQRSGADLHRNADGAGESRKTRRE